MRIRIDRCLTVLFAAVVSSGLAATDLEIAKKALRDNLWEIARSRAEKAGGHEAKLVILESYARENKWSEILKSLDSWTVPSEDAFIFYKALAEAQSNGIADCSEILSRCVFSDSAYAESLAALVVQKELDAGNVEKAKKIVEKYSLDSGDDDAKAVSAAAFSAAGDVAKAKSLWLKIVASTNAGDRAFALSAWNLGDVAVLSNAYARIEESAALRRTIGLKLGVSLLDSSESFEEGKKLIVALVNDSPGADGAREAFVFLAGKCLERGEYEEAANFFHKAIEAWPDAARDYGVHEGLAWAFLKLGKNNESILSFSRAEECATNDVDRATAILMQGDILSTLGRGDESMVKYRDVLSRYPETPAGEKLKKIVELKDLESRGRDLYRDFRFGEALDVFAEIAKRSPVDKPRMDYLEMLCLYGKGKDAEASDKARALASECPDATIKAEATLWLAKFFYNSKQWQESCGLFANYATNMMPSSPQAPSALLWASRAAFAGGEFRRCVDLVTKLAKDHHLSPEKLSAYILQGEALMELSRFDEAIVVFKTVVSEPTVPHKERSRARILLGDALFVMGADNPGRYRESLECFRSLYMDEQLDASQKITVAFKIARTLEKLDQLDSALDQYYGEVVCAYRNFRMLGEVFNEEAKTCFARAVFSLADEYESRGQDEKAKNILRLLIRSDVESSEQEARRRLRRIKQKGSF